MPGNKAQELRRELRIGKLLEDMRGSGINLPKGYDANQNVDELLRLYKGKFQDLCWTGLDGEPLRLIKDTRHSNLQFKGDTPRAASPTLVVGEGTAKETDAVEFVDGLRNRPCLEGAILKCKNKESLEFWTGFLEQHSGVPWEPLIERGRDAFPGDRVVIPRFCKLIRRIGDSPRERRDYEGIPMEAIDIAFKKDKKPEIIIRGWDGSGTEPMQALALEGCCFVPVCSVAASAANRNLPCEVEAVIHKLGVREALRPGYLKDRVRRDVTDVSEYAFAAGTSKRVAKVGNVRNGDTVECWCVLMAAKFFRTPTAGERAEFEAVQARKRQGAQRRAAEKAEKKKAKSAQK